MASSAHLNDSDLLSSLLRKLSVCPGLSFAAIAADAHSMGRARLAALLLDHEPRSSEQVRLLRV